MGAKPSAREAHCRCMHDRFARLCWRGVASRAGLNATLPNRLNERLRSRPFMIDDTVSLLLAARLYETAGHALSCEQLELEMLLRYPQAGLAAEDVRRALAVLTELGLVRQRFLSSAADGSANEPVFTVAAPERAF